MKEITLDAYILDTLMPDLVGHDRHPSAFLVYLFLWRLCGQGRAIASLGQIAEGTGLSKRSVQTALTRLEKRRLILIKRENKTAIPEFKLMRPWRDRFSRILP